MDYKKVVNYWLKTSEHDLEIMLSLYRSKKYDACLYYGHIILEKILKAHVVKHVKMQAPRIHNLVRLAQNTGISFSDDQISLLGKINQFNMRTRYPDDKLSFYKICDKNYTDKYYSDILSLYKFLCQEIKRKNK